MRRAILLISTWVTALFLGYCSLGLDPVSKPDFSGLIRLATGDSTTLVLTRLMALENDQILAYEVTGISDTTVARVRNLSGDSLLVIGGLSGICDLTLLAAGTQHRYEVELKISVSSTHQSDSANRVNLGDTLTVNLWDYGIPETTTIDSVQVNFSPAGICQRAALMGGLLSFSTLRPGETSASVAVWQGSTRTLIEIELVVFIHRMVLAELFTNAGCIPCAPANELLNEIKAESSANELAVLRYHVSWPSPNDPMYNYNRSESTARVFYYGISQAPTLVIDGTFAPNSTDLWSTQIQQASVNNAVTKIEIPNITDIGADSIAINYQIESYAETELTNLRVMCVVTEDSVEFLGDNGEDLHMQVMRDYHHSQVAALAPESQFLGLSRLKWLAGSPDRSRYTVLVFIQSEGDKKILQATQKTLN